MANLNAWLAVLMPPLECLSGLAVILWAGAEECGRWEAGACTIQLLSAP